MLEVRLQAGLQWVVKETDMNKPCAVEWCVALADTEHDSMFCKHHTEDARWFHPTQERPRYRPDRPPVTAMLKHLYDEAMR
jgi:hypothetical protein